MRRATIAAFGVAVLAGVASGVASAEKPAQNISASRHPNLAAAQRLCVQAFDKVDAAQHANEWDLNGHAKKAKQLLEEVNEELKQAALAANAKK